MTPEPAPDSTGNSWVALYFIVLPLVALLLMLTYSRSVQGDSVEELRARKRSLIVSGLHETWATEASAKSSGPVWVDKAKGVVAVSIDEAVKLTASTLKQSTVVASTLSAPVVPKAGVSSAGGEYVSPVLPSAPYGAITWRTHFAPAAVK